MSDDFPPIYYFSYEFALSAEHPGGDNRIILCETTASFIIDRFNGAVRFDKKTEHWIASFGDIETAQKALDRIKELSPIYYTEISLEEI